MTPGLCVHVLGQHFIQVSWFVCSRWASCAKQSCYWLHHREALQQTRGRTYLSTGCIRCDSLLGTFFVQEAYEEQEVVCSFPIRVSIAKNQSDIQKKIDKLFAEFAKAQLSETTMRLKQGRLLKQVAAYCDANNCSLPAQSHRAQEGTRLDFDLGSEDPDDGKDWRSGLVQADAHSSKLEAVYNKKFGQWKLCHDQWCKPGETSVVATILSSRDEEADGGWRSSLRSGSTKPLN
jgi:hypothetical protein